MQIEDVVLILDAEIRCQNMLFKLTDPYSCVLKCTLNLRQGDFIFLSLKFSGIMALFLAQHY